MAELKPADLELAKKMELAGKEIVASNELLNGKSFTRIAEKLDMTLDQVREMFVRPGMRKYLKEMQRRLEDDTAAARCTLQHTINDGFIDAVNEALVSIIRSPESADRDRIRAAEVLGKYQNLVAPATKQAEKGKPAKDKPHFVPREIENMKNALREVGRPELAAAMEANQNDLVQ